MEKVKCNIHYGTKELKDIFDEIINQKINEITRDIKKGKISKYNTKADKLSTNCNKEQEVVSK